MTQTSLPRYSLEEFAQRGQALYENEIRSALERDNKGKVVAIDIETGAFEVAEDTLSASDLLYSRLPNAQIWCVRVGHSAVHRLGAYRAAEAE